MSVSGTWPGLKHPCQQNISLCVAVCNNSPDNMCSVYPSQQLLSRAGHCWIFPDFSAIPLQAPVWSATIVMMFYKVIFYHSEYVLSELSRFVVKLTLAMLCVSPGLMSTVSGQWSQVQTFWILANILTGNIIRECYCWRDDVFLQITVHSKQM